MEATSSNLASPMDAARTSPPIIIYHTDQPATDQPFSRLLSRELRNMIWAPVVVNHNGKTNSDLTTVLVGTDANTPVRLRRAIVAQPPITLACRQTREEALPIFYNVNAFIWALSARDVCYSFEKEETKLSIVVQWLKALTERERRWLRRVVLQWQSGQMLAVGLAKHEVMELSGRGW
ncbi:hypothetical protein BAUCODRAFT_148855 [Baudoinia panamericana UAMH 10762]|uniref:Uncharacterized protein n=1 Tax=Baudoinia panamericana (strain UAMH 10762) TaxID=717646 RepID=M2LNT7_BAUPA|nr:uncharacterized protein BAUCODRAFT_148855 [Baudoinia panamericana UAMH 10762]EMC96017.1 hypothetical protein BAUCODRAFT_148855 [Baudoinia panamericana UAMH 10762]